MFEKCILYKVHIVEEVCLRLYISEVDNKLFCMLPCSLRCNGRLCHTVLHHTHICHPMLHHASVEYCMLYNAMLHYRWLSLTILYLSILHDSFHSYVMLCYDIMSCIVHQSEGSSIRCQKGVDVFLSYNVDALSLLLCHAILLSSAPSFALIVMYLYIVYIHFNIYVSIT